MNLVIISGAEATGKTHIGMTISKNLGYVYIAKDAIKEHMFDTESVSNWNYKWYEKLAKEKFFVTVENNLKDNKNTVIESNFSATDKKRLQHSISAYSVNAVEIYCTSKGLISFRRFVSRNEQKKRHKGHHDRRWYLLVLLHVLSNNLKIYNARKPVKLTDKLLIVDTTNYEQINYKKILEFIAST